ncbi:MAG: glycosyltransferase family 9 protein [Ignavibacteria bacterium]|jgi:lipopolysaccharide heptosyltransferase II|nr:glycosyltransferase family 9 protein [Ignavibacteria bacterium]MCU7500147.1 glycosyltransferase family 9 protein [Ignavibacteria bacterium]MCU7511534.1 glycosyltransferase family 9 protein [Ignavibacteria bacterium]MCU7521039.1 glycosyltransferase family 9 protein [Ignavibacteria bacterium]MCU7524340.1 glycosyltransferase family 9 protein [Ignavibacteria bacterium]
MFEPKNLLIVRTDRIGDLVLTLPLAGIVKKHFPRAKVSFLVREYTKDIAASNSKTDRVIVLKENKGKASLWENVKLLRQYKFDSCMVVYPTFRIALTMLLSGIPHRIGTGYRWYSFLFNHKTFEHRKNAEHHELEYNVNLLKHYGINEPVTRENAAFDLHANSPDGQKIEQLLSENGVNFKYPVIIVHPGSGGSAVDWPILRFKELVQRLVRNLGCTVIVTGSESENEICKGLTEGTNALNLAGKLSMKELIALIDKSDMMIANSTGPIHLAAAFKKNVVGFYPRITACSPERWGPYTEKRMVFSPEINCTNCTREQCEKLNCMDTIKADKVFEYIKSVLNIVHNGELHD